MYNYLHLTVLTIQPMPAEYWGQDNACVEKVFRSLNVECIVLYLPGNNADDGI